MSDDEVVETSDPEEREALRADKTEYWRPIPRTPPPRVPSQTTSLSPTSSTSQLSHLSISSEKTREQEDVQSQGSEPDRDHRTRYALRQRQAKQLNPYAYDKLLYKKQMKSNPDAIVRMTSPSAKRRTDGYERAASQDTVSEDGSYEAPEERMSVSPRPQVWGPGYESDGWGGVSVEGEGLGLSGNDELDLISVLGHATRTSPGKRKKRSIFARATSEDIEMVDGDQTKDLPRPAYSTNSDGEPTRVASQDSGSENEDPEEGSSLPPSPRQKVKGLRELKKVWPAVMVNQYLQHGTPQSKRKRAARLSHHSDSEDERPLRPGETRVRRPFNSPGSVRDIKGDTESSEEQSGGELHHPGPPSSVTMDMDVLTTPSSKRSPRRQKSSPLDVSPQYIGSSEESSSSDDDVNDADISAWLTGKPVPRRRENLIDWMLTRTRTVGAKPNRKNRSASGAKPRSRRGPRLHVVTSGAQRRLAGRQTLLSLDQTKTKWRSAGFSGGHVHRRSSPGPMLEAEDAGRKDGQDQGRGGRLKKRVRSKSHVHVFTSKGTRISSGRRKGVTLTVNMGDEGFRNALAPVTMGRMERGDGHPSAPKSRVRSSTVFGPLDVFMLPEEADFIQPERSQHRFCDIKPDCDIPFLRTGTAFPSDTYLGKGWLHELIAVISDTANIGMPVSYSAHGCDLSPIVSIPDFVGRLALICDRLLDFVSSRADNRMEDMKLWENLMHVACQLVSWLASGADSENGHLLQNAVREQVQRLICHLEEQEQDADDVVFAMYWFAIELSARVDYALSRHEEKTTQETDVLVQCILRTIQRLLGYGLQQTMIPVLAGEDGLKTFSAHRTTELWISLFHLLGKCDVCAPSIEVGAHVHPLWRILLQTFQSRELKPGLETSEMIWKTIFSLCALSQFSVHGMATPTCRIGAAWELVILALSQIRLVAAHDKDYLGSNQTFDKRDAYVGVMVSRCFVLWHRWHWNLGHASTLFHKLAEIFRSRSFANLRHEPADFPAFMLENDPGSLSQFRPDDTAFTTFLKLIVQGAKSEFKDDESLPRPALSPKTKKILALVIPIGSVPFTKENPPDKHELSMLHNRLSAIAIAIYLDNTPENVRFRLAHARQYANFRTADDSTRTLCVRGAIFFALLMQYLRISLVEVFDWFSDMTNVLVEELKEAMDPAKAMDDVARNRPALLMNVLLGSVGSIIEHPGPAVGQSKSEYPEPHILDGAWITRLLSTKTGLTNYPRSGTVIRRLLHDFLAARAAVIPPPRIQCSVPATTGESQESQDEYGALELDLDDPELLAALGDSPTSPEAIEIKEKDVRVARAMDKHIFPSIHFLMCKFFNGLGNNTVAFVEYCREADSWIDCWVGCANVIVHNQLRNWSRYFHLAPQCWDPVAQSSWRRRAGLRFSYTVLQHDPRTYTTQQDQFLRVFFESLVVAKGTLEHKYVSLLLTVDGLHHWLFHELPCRPDPVTSRFDISASGLLDSRKRIIEVTSKNLEKSLRSEKRGEVVHTIQNQESVGFFVDMLTSMESNSQELVTDPQIRMSYLGFCKDVSTLILQNAELSSQSRISRLVAWGQNL